MKGSNPLICSVKPIWHKLELINGRGFVRAREPDQVEKWLLEHSSAMIEMEKGVYRRYQTYIDKAHTHDVSLLNGWLTQAKKKGYMRIAAAISAELREIAAKPGSEYLIVADRRIMKNAPVYHTLEYIAALLKTDGVPRFNFWAVGVLFYAGVNPEYFGLDRRSEDFVKIYEEQSTRLSEIEKRADRCIKRAKEYHQRIEEIEREDLL